MRKVLRSLSATATFGSGDSSASAVEPPWQVLENGTTGASGAGGLRARGDAGDQRNYDCCGDGEAGRVRCRNSASHAVNAMMMIPTITTSVSMPTVPR